IEFMAGVWTISKRRKAGIGGYGSVLHRLPGRERARAAIANKIFSDE
ncbi:MAG: hypothetical protein H0U54_14265, partial [Acidobacteria bacterium]|nr:hypothetical protein [Acidobacteriota bacterium]